MTWQDCSAQDLRRGNCSSAGITSLDLHFPPKVIVGEVPLYTTLWAAIIKERPISSMHYGLGRDFVF